MYKYRCNKCGFECGEHYRNGKYQEELWITENHLFEGNGCACCCNAPQIVIPGINDIPTTAFWMVKYFQGGYNEAKLYSKNSSQHIFPICPECNRVKNKSMIIANIYKRKSISCSCGDGQSYPNKFCFSLLEQLKIKFISEYQPDWIKPKRFDFYFKINNNKGFIVEMDGGLGHGKNVHRLSGQTKEETQLIDDYKDKLAKEHGIEVIRIDSEESELNYIKNNILDSKLSELFDLSAIDWLQAGEFALSNLVKKACEIKRDNPDMSTTEIGEIMNLSGDSIRNYLKKGSKIWDWINYNPKEEIRKNSRKAGKSKGKTVEIFKDGVKLDKFESCSELSRRSEEKFGVKLLSGNISEVCRYEKLQYKGYTFRYID